MHPADWRLCLLGDVTEKVMVGIASAATHAYRSSGISLLRNLNIRPGYIDEQDVLQIDPAFEAIHKNKRLKAGDVLVVRTGYPGVSAVVPERFDGAQCFTSLIVRPLKTELHPDYFCQYMNSVFGERLSAAAEAGGAQKNLNAGELEKLQLHLPPLQEQRRIAALLSTWDQAIATSRQLVENAQSQLDCLLQQLLIQPAAHGEWESRPISMISERIQRRSTADEELPVLMISSGSGFVRQDEKYSRYMAGKSVENYIALHSGEFAYNKGNSKRYEFGCVFPMKDYERGLVPHVYVCFKLLPNLHAAFYEHLFRADYLRDQLGALVNTGVRNNGLLNIRPTDFLACRVPVPSIQVQRQIAEVLTTAARWVESHERDLDLLKRQKAALQSQLLTGKRRVKLPAAEAEVQA